MGSRRRERLAGLSSFLVAGDLALEPRGRGPKLLRMSVLELARVWGEGGDWGGGGDEFQRVTQTSQLRHSESFLDASVTFSCVRGGEHWLTSLLELSAEEGLPSDWYTSLAKWSRMMRAALCASKRVFFTWVGVLGYPRVGRAEGEELPGGRPNDYSVLGEYDSVDWGEKRLALDVVLEFVVTAFG